MGSALTLLALLAGCAARDPALRPMLEIPLAPPSPAPFATEEAAAAAVLAVLDGAGLPMDALRVVALDGPGPELPTLHGAVVQWSRWRTTDAAARYRLEAVLRDPVQAPVDLSAWSDTEAQAAWSALQVVLLAQQLSRAAEAKLKFPADPRDPLAQERRAAAAGTAALRQLVALGQAPADWERAWQRLLREALAVASPATRPIFEMTLALAEQPPPLDALAQAYDQPDLTARRVAEAGRALSAAEDWGEGGCRAQGAGLLCQWSEQASILEIVFVEDQREATARWLQPVAAPGAGEGELLRRLNEANRSAGGGCTFLLEDHQVVAQGRPVNVTGSDDVLNEVHRLEQQCAGRLAALMVADGAGGAR